MAKLRSLIAGFALVGGLCAVQPEPDGGRSAPLGAMVAGGESAEAAIGRPDEAKPAAEANAPLPVRTAAAIRESRPVTRSAVGWIEPAASVTVQARIDAEIVEQTVTEGQRVKAGDVLFRLGDRELKAKIARSEAILARDRARLAGAIGDLERIKELVAKAVASPSQRDQAAAQVQILAAEVAASEAALLADRIALDHATIRAPIDGRVGAVDVRRGSFVGPSASAGEGLLTITQMQPLRVSFTLPERDLGLLRAALGGTGETAEVQVLSSDGDRLLGTGPVSFLDSAVDTQSGTIGVLALLSNKDEALWPGQYVRVQVTFGVERDLVTVPLGALISHKEGARTFVAAPDGTAVMREVELAEIRGERALIASGLRPGEEVIVEGGWRLYDGAQISAGPDQPITVADRNAGAILRSRP